MGFISTPTAPLHVSGISEVTGFINTKYSDPRLEHPDIQFFFGGFLANCARTGQVGERVDNNTRSIQIIPTVLHPKSRGFLKLKDNNPLSPPLIYANYFTHPDDMKVMIEGIKFALRLADSKGKCVVEFCTRVKGDDFSAETLRVPAGPHGGPRVRELRFWY
jgi:choline dehydrogenase-like flavoprotein